jgi:hypothetical protein
MKARAAVAVILYLLAVLLPSFYLFSKFGMNVRIDLNEPAHLIALAAAAVFTFVLATVAGVLLRKSDEPEWIQLVEACLGNTD